ncbi:D-alanyl-D-alanine carboxypeptidase/D-alanyl-D-alanine endopeptidase [Bacillus sp. FJAT-45350]|uniref:D-alanyl-D-alanine carboxypeptidase/D-alanyl-D-alanine endopeptidase n=1 Tax=Bacillus sp. FJAT-45350 TaxID=2011014 RepID=UPI00211BAFB3|nr:D-alanyl-D-alanine carboxypeptidase/D-alanyl-D-alanine-endopeptidase [Bacillus sp. FJAT-45350]
MSVFICFLLFLVQPLESHAIQNKEALTQQLNHLITNDTELSGVLVGVSIRSSKTGEILYEHLGDIRLRPASNMKLLTGAGALSVLGEDYKFETELLTDGKNRLGFLNGNLYIKGKGDSTLQKEDIDRLVQNVKESGVNVILGDVIADDTWYDDVRYSIDVPWSDEAAYYGAQISALTISPNNNYDAGTIQVKINEGVKIGEEAEITLHPNTDYVTISNNTKTVGNDEKNTIKITRKHGTNLITIDGDIPNNSDEISKKVAVWEPTDLVLEVVKQSLKEHGIKLMGDSKRGEVPLKAVTMMSHQSKPLSEILIPFMKLSNNTIAEGLIKELGKVKEGEGSWDKGLEVLLSELEQFGIDSYTLVLRDGSGISHVNLLTANELSNLLYKVQERGWFETYKNSLPVSGEEEELVGGTLRHRMTSPNVIGKVLAKTGTISTVSSLSGFVDCEKEELIFSIIVNNVIETEKGKEIEDAIISILLE